MNSLRYIMLLAWLVPIIGTSQVYFDNYYNTGYNNLLSCNVIAMEDSNFIFVNYLQDSATGRQDAGFISIDKNGNEILHNSFNYFNEPWNTFINRKHFIQTSKSSFFLSGADFNSNALFCKIDKLTLDTIRTQKIETPGYGYNLNSFIKIHSNKFLLIGSLSSSSISYAFALHLDSNLTIVDNYTVSSVTTDYACRSAIVNPLSGSIILHGTSTLSGYPNAFYKVDTFFTANSSSLSVTSLTRTINQIYYSAADTSLVCLGYYKTGTFSGYPIVKMCISKYSLDFRLRWQKTYGEASVLNSVGNAVILPDGSIVTCGKYATLSSLPFSNSDYNGIIMKVDKDGHFRWMREYSHYGPSNLYEGFYGLDRTLDGGFILCGSVQNLAHAKAWAVKTDSMGCVTPGCASTTLTVDSLIIPQDPVVTVGSQIINPSNTYLQLYPNPVKDELTIESLLNEAYTVSLCSIQGEEIKRFQFSQKDKISTTDLVAGVYLLKFYQHQQLSQTKKVVVIK